MPLRILLLALLLPAAAPGCGPADDAGSVEGASTEAGTAAAARSRDGAVAEGPAVAADAPDRSGPRVLFVGTSLTAGLGLLSADGTFTARLQAMADSAGVAARMVNAGVSGETSAGGLRRIGWLLADTVDVLVLELGANDGLRGQDPAALEANLKAIIDSTRARWPGAEVIVAGMQAPPNLGPRYTESFREVFPRVARERHARLVPFLLDGVAGVAELNQGDGIHPTAEGHARIASTLWPVLAPVLEGRAQP